MRSARGSGRWSHDRAPLDRTRRALRTGQPRPRGARGVRAAPRDLRELSRGSPVVPRSLRAFGAGRCACDTTCRATRTRGAIRSARPSGDPAVGSGGRRCARYPRRIRLDVAQSQLDSTKYVVAALLDSSVAITDLAATGKAPSMRLYWNRARNIVVVAAFDLPPAPAGRTYQLWAIEKGRAPVSVGTFNSAPSGRPVITLQMPAGVQPEVSAVTEEPAGGSPQPTQQPFLVGSWRSRS